MNTNVQWGWTSTLGVLSVVLGGVGTVIAAIKANDTATVTAGTSTVVTAIGTLGGRFAQAVALARRYAPIGGALAAGVGTEAVVATPSDAGLPDAPLSDSPVVPDEQ